MNVIRYYVGMSGSLFNIYNNMKESIIIYTPNEPEDYGAFDDSEPEKVVCAVCGEDAEIEVRTLGVPIPECVCMKCYAHPDYQEIVLKNNLKRKLI